MKPFPMTRVCLSAAILCAISVSGAWAQRTTFNPSINVGAGYTDNIAYEDENERSDTSSRIELDLPVSRQWDSGSMEFYYRPSYTTQRDEDDFDRDEHRLGFNTTSVIDRRTNWGFSAAYSKTQVQFSPAIVEFDPIDDDPFVSNPTDRESYGASLNLARTQSPRWNWQASLDWSQIEHDLIDGESTSAAGGSPVEDRSEYGGTFGFSRSLGRGASLGLQYRHQRFDLDVGGEEDSDSLSVTWNRTVSRTLEFGLSVGGFKSTGEASDGTSLATDDDERTGAQGSFNLTRSFRNSRLVFSASHQPTSGSNLVGTSTNTDAGVTYAGTRRLWDWSVSGRYGLREPSDPASFDLTNVSAGASIERFFRKQIGVRFGTARTDQSSDRPDDPLTGVNSDDRSAFSVEIGFVWYPLGRTKLGGGSSS